MTPATDKKTEKHEKQYAIEIQKRFVVCFVLDILENLDHWRIDALFDYFDEIFEDSKLLHCFAKFDNEAKQLLERKNSTNLKKENKH